MKLTVNLWSRKTGEIRRFLKSYFNKEVELCESTGAWACNFSKPLDSVDLISAVMDNNDKYQIAVCIQIDQGQLHLITPDNHNDVIRDIYNLFYNENVLAYH